VRGQNPRVVNIRSGMNRDLRLWYFEGVNKLPEFTPPSLNQGSSFPKPGKSVDDLKDFLERPEDKG